MSNLKWLPLESNPEVMNKYGKNLGLKDGYSFTDVFGLDPELLMMVPRPVKAVVLLYPITQKSEDKVIGEETADTSLFFIKQTISNACGTIGILHSLTNNKDCLSDDAQKFIAQFMKDTRNSSAAERAEYIEKSELLSNAHQACAVEGQTEAPSVDDKVNFHFVAFVHHDGKLFELDGRKQQPMNHGKTTPDSFMEDAALVIKQFMDRDPGSMNFSVVALTKEN